MLFEKRFSRFANIVARAFSALILASLIAASLPGATQAAHHFKLLSPYQPAESGMEAPSGVLSYCKSYSPGNSIQVGSPGHLDGQVSNNRIKIWGWGLNPKHNFVVKLRAYGFSWRRIGTIKPSDSGNFEATYNVPTNMRKARTLEVCLKEVLRGYLICTNVKNR